MLGGFLSMRSSDAEAQVATPDPGSWRPMAYAELQYPSPAMATYVDIWKDAIDQNNRAYALRGDHRYFKANAPASEAHFVIWSSRRSAVLSVLDAATLCSVKTALPEMRAIVKLCPMRIAIYEGLQVKTLDAGKACFLELEPSDDRDPSASAAYASYDVARRALKIGLVVDHAALDGCSFDVPLPRQ
jgi:hypothetical protein